MNDLNKQRNKYLLKNTAIFAVGNFASKFVSFFLVPLYTNFLTAAQYGITDLFYTVCTFLVPLFTLNVMESVLRFLLDKNADRKKITKIACSMLLLASTMGLLAVPIIYLFDGYREWAWYFYFYMLSFAFSQIFLALLKGQEKLKLYSFGNFLQATLIASLNILFLMVLNMGPAGYFLAYIVANLVVAFYAMLCSKVFAHLKGAIFDRRLFKDMTKYSVILIPTSFMWWIMNFSDRIMISGIIGTAESGIYAASCKLPTVLSSASTIFLQAWLFSAIKNDGKEGNEKYTNKIFTMLAMVLFGVSMILLILLKPIFSIYVAPEFYVAWQYVPMLIIGHAIMALSTFMSTSYNVKKDSKGFLYSAAIGAMVNVILNAILIPLFGVQGAVVATTLSYMAVFAYRLWDTKKYIKIWIGPRIILSFLMLAIVAFMVFADSLPISLTIQMLVLGCFLAINYKSLKLIFVNIAKKRGKNAKH